MTHLPRRQLEEQLVDCSRRLHQNGWVANHDGNLTAMLAEDRFLATPTSVSKGAVTRSSLIVVDGHGKVHSGTGKAFTELALHLFVYRARPDVRAVIHAHPPVATGFCVAGVPVRTTMMAEPVVSLGASIPLVPYALPKSPEWTTALAPYLIDADVLLLEHHGVLSFGPDLETAFLRLELCENLARIQLAAHQIGVVREIPVADVDKLLAARTKAGLGRAAREATAAKPPAGGSAVTGAEPKVRALVREELGRVLSGRS